NTNPIFRLRKRANSFAGSEKGSTSSKSTCPDVGSSNVPRMYNSVDLPQPLGPTIERFSPADIASSTPSKTRNVSAAERNSLQRLWTTNLDMKQSKESVA